MTVYEFTKLSVADVMFQIVNADKTGFMTTPEIMIEADKNVVRKLYGDRIVVYFELVSKKRMILYTKEATNAENV